MRSLILSILAFACLAGVPRLAAQQLNWGSTVGALDGSTIVDSTGAALDNTFVFELGAFLDGFTPDESNVDDWITNWRVFDQAAYNSGDIYFTGTANMLDDGTSDSPDQTSGAPSFEGLQAYIWIRNSDLAEEGSEWLLTRADSWTFPTATPGCCDNQGVVEWSVSDLDSGDIPVWGNQGGYEGGGSYTTTGPYTLQTYTFVPEPSSLLLAAVSGLLVFRRRRDPVFR